MEISECPACNSSRIKIAAQREYEFRESGLRNVLLLGGVQKIKCPDCRGSFTYIPKMFQAFQLINVGLLMKPAPLSGPEIKYLRKSCELNQAELAALIRSNRRPTLSEWEARDAPAVQPQFEIVLRAVLLDRFLTLVANDEKRLLTAVQYRRLKAFAANFYREVGKLLALDPEAIPNQIIAARVDGKKNWQLTPRAA
jgi:hypothetical protein